MVQIIFDIIVIILWTICAVLNLIAGYIVITILNIVIGIILDESFGINIAVNIAAIFKICENLIFDKALE